MLCIVSSVFVFVILFLSRRLLFFFFNDTATTEIYTLSLHDALPISSTSSSGCAATTRTFCPVCRDDNRSPTRSASADRKSTRLNSSHLVISYAVFCLKKKKRPRGLPPRSK